ncbi:MAG TPA: Crp/Fnr family transcriptional regulator [Herpetosiphonaceae bacterium]|jgi:CRP/FNR family transcriptional regulator|nr:Crp/Fnr family transcriptional regulator [Herpetosiphonaceae bacterium]
MVTPELIATIPLFKDLPPGARSALARVLQDRRYRPGQYLIHQDCAPEGLFVICEGRVRLARIAPDGREQVLQMAGPGELFNAEPLFDGGPTPASARAMSPVRALLLPSAVLVALIGNHPSIALLLLRELSARQRELVILLEDLHFRSVRARLARVLLREARDGAAAITQQELAERAGTVREIAGRTLRDMQQEGLVRLLRGQVMVLDLDGLRNVSEE